MKTCLAIHAVLLLTPTYHSSHPFTNKELHRTRSSYIPKSRRSRLSAMFSNYQRKIPSSINRWMLSWSMSRIEKERYRLLMKERKRLQEKYRPRKRWPKVAILAYWAMAMQAKSADATQRVIHFDTDSRPLGVDNRCSGCISSFVEDFEGVGESSKALEGPALMES